MKATRIISSGFCLACIIPLILGIFKSLSSTNPFCPPIIKGSSHERTSFPPSISLSAIALSELISSEHLITFEKVRRGLLH